MKQFLAIALLCVVLCTNAQIPAGAIGDWPFDNNAQDVSGNGNHGTISGAIPARDRFDIPNKAYMFNGVSSKIVVPHNNSIDIGAGVDFTFTYWQKAYKISSTQVIINKHAAGTWNGYCFVGNNTINPGYCTGAQHTWFYTASGGQEDACSNSPVMADTLWHFIVGMYDATNNVTSMYVDNVLQSDIGQSSGIMSNPADLSFGNDDDLKGYFFSGVLDGARLYKRMLTIPELTELFNEECQKPEAPQDLTPFGNHAVCKNTNIVLTASATGTVNWYTNLTSVAPISTGTFFTTPALAAGTHTWYVAAKTNCGESAIRTAITVTVNQCTALYERLASPGSFEIYPNPNSGSFILRAAAFPGKDKTEVVILNQLSQVVFQEEISNAETTLNMNLPVGVYFVKVSDDKDVVLRKLVIQ